MILLIDNYDSFSYNLYQLVGELAEDIKVIRNDELSVAQIADLQPEKIILSPGPGRPENAGVIIDCIKGLGNKISILGVCLGHQAICAALGGKIVYAQELMHGKQSMVNFQTDCPLFAGCAAKSPVARYHSLIVDRETLPECLAVTAATDDNLVMGIQHKELPIFGVQFHPESIMTPQGKMILKNFIALK